MKVIKKLVVLPILALGILVGLSACSESDVASHNLSKDADNFKSYRRVVVFNTIKGETLFTVEGRISIKADNDDHQLEIVEKTKNKTYKKHFIGLSDNTSYLVEDLTGNANVNTNQFKITYNPSVLIPTLENTHN